MPTDDLASAFRQQPSATMRYGQGRIISWNPETFENVIEWNGEPLENLPVVGTTDALSYQPGQYVALHGMDSSGQKAAMQWWIAGRILIPGTDNAESVIDFLRGTLAREISAEIFAARIHTALDEGVAQSTNGSYGDPTSGNPGPTISGVDISEAGKAVVLLGGLMRSSVGFTTEETGHMSVAITGASSVPASDVNSAYLHATVVDSASQLATTTLLATVTRVIVFDTLTPGTHTFTAKYRRGPAHDSVYVYNRSLVVFAF